MAGIGFRLEKILSKNSYTNLLEGYTFSAVVTAGPMIFTIMSIGILGVLAEQHLHRDDMLIFRTIIVYVYATTLILSSPIQMIFTRYMSDRIYFKDFQALVPAFVCVTLLAAFIHAVVGYTAIYFLDLDFGTEISCVVLLVTVSTIWIAMNVLSAAKDFTWILYSFAIGSLVGTAIAYYLSIYFGLFGILAGFTLGQIVLYTMLAAQIFTDFDYRKRVEFEILGYFKPFFTLSLISFFYNIGIWADKIVFWMNRDTSQQIHTFLRASYIYDMPIFVSYLFIVPALAMFTIKVETSFYINYKRYFIAISDKHPLASLEDKRKTITKDLRNSIGRITVMQATVTIIAIVLAPLIYPYLKLAPTHIAIFQITLVSTFLLALLLTLFIIILYFDLRTDALITSFIFASTNITFSMISIRLGFPFYGYGYFASCLLSLIVGFVLLNYRLGKLHYYTFATQRIITHKEAE